MSRLIPVCLFASAVLAQGSALAAPACSRQSPAHTVALLELYTSEGCSSCPPADRFVGGLRAGGFSPEQVVPLALHVDYWDHIGWKDAFADRRYTERQYWLSGLARSRVVYTPEIFIGGHELRNWRGGTAAAISRINSMPARAQIGLGVVHQDKKSVQVEVSARAPQDARLFVALYQNGLSSDVKAGENSGVQLMHDYVVRDWIGPLSVGPGAGQVTLPRALALPSGASAGNLGVAAFVQDGQGEVLQALALPLCAG